MESIKILLDIAHYLALDEVISELKAIETRTLQDNANIILPLVGEFSSGKTTLINSLTDSKKLETATKPTTATIYEVHFSSETCHAMVVEENGEMKKVEDIAELKNTTLADAKAVTVFDTNREIPASTILVDTPGLSSPDPKHKQTLVDFLPMADAILLVTDINQQITRSLTNFIATMKLSKKPIFLILTKSDTKSISDVGNAKAYISKNCDIPIEQVAVVSAQKNDLTEMYELLDNIQKNKKKILEQVDNQRIKNITDVLMHHIEGLMTASASDKEMEMAIRQCELGLKKVERNIEKLVDSVKDEVDDKTRNTTRDFEDTVSSKLNALVAGKSNNFDNEALTIINNSASLMMNDYRNAISAILSQKAANMKGSEGELPLGSLHDIDLSSVQMGNLSYNLDLNSMGHEYDNMIKTGLIVAAAAGAVCVGAAALGGAAVTGTAAAGEVAAAGGSAVAETAAAATTVGTVVNVADTVTDIGSIVSNRKAISRIEKATTFIGNASDKYNTYNNLNEQVGQNMGAKKGMVDSLVGWATESMMSKPQRVRAIRNYIDGTLSPEFTSNLQKISASVVDSVRMQIIDSTKEILALKTDTLNQLRTEMKEKKDLFDAKMDKLREFKSALLTL